MRHLFSRPTSPTRPTEIPVRAIRKSVWQGREHSLTLVPKGEDPMPKLIPLHLPDPPCSGALPDGSDCPAPAAATITAEHPTIGCTMLVWRCRDHIGAAVDAIFRACPGATVVTSPLSAAESPHPKPRPQSEPAPEQPAKRPLYLVHHSSARLSGKR
jgi:hypothetical protein